MGHAKAVLFEDLVSVCLDVPAQVFDLLLYGVELLLFGFLVRAKSENGNQCAIVVFEAGVFADLLSEVNGGAVEEAVGLNFFGEGVSGVQLTAFQE